MLFADRRRTVARGWLRVVIVCGTSHSSGGQWPPRDEDVRQEVLLRGGGRWCNGIFAIIGGKLPRDPSLGLSCNLAADSQGGGRG